MSYVRDVRSTFLKRPYLTNSMTMVLPYMGIFSHHANACNIVHRHMNDKQFEIIPKKSTEQFLKYPFPTPAELPTGFAASARRGLCSI
jgi:hypothetical protein